MQPAVDGFTAVEGCPSCTARAVCRSLAAPEWGYGRWFSKVHTPAPVCGLSAMLRQLRAAPAGRAGYLMLGCRTVGRGCGARRGWGEGGRGVQEGPQACSQEPVPWPDPGPAVREGAGELPPPPSSARRAVLWGAPRCTATAAACALAWQPCCDKMG